MEILNLNPRHEIGASAWFVEVDGHHLLLDAGTHPKLEGREALPLYNLIKDEDLEAVALTHCHFDHVGSLPVALQYFPHANVFMSELSYFIVERVLHNSVNVMTRQREEAGIKDYPLYRHDEVDEIAPLFQGYKYGQEFHWTNPHKAREIAPTMEFFDAGHALGSAGTIIRGRDHTMFYTGDVCFRDQTLLKGARFEDVKADVLIMETTRGAREVPASWTREQEVERLTQSINRVLQRKGSVLIPSFALGRTQEMLALLALLMKSGELKKRPIYIGGLGRVFTEIYDLEAHRIHRHHSNLRLTEALNLIVLGKNELEKMKLGGGRIFVITAGMMNENTAAHDLAVRMANDEKQAIFFVGYADPDTPAGRLRKAPRGEPFFFSQSAGELVRNCEMEEFDLTAHANRDELLEFVGQVDPETVILGHGDQEARSWFHEQIAARYPGKRICEPGPGERVKL